MTINFIPANWPAPINVHALTTTRLGGVSEYPYTSFNLGGHCGDNPEHVQQNRKILQTALNLSNQVKWLKQTHSDIVIPFADYNNTNEADGIYTTQALQVCAVLTADCLPILVCNRAGTEIAAIHAGWRGLAKGIIEKGLNHFQSPPSEILAWLGPAIGPKVYEVGEEVLTAFLAQDPQSIQAFQPSPNGRWLVNLYLLATQRLQKKGVTAIYGGDFCTYSDQPRFYSYRRDGQASGRLASLIWLTNA